MRILVRGRTGGENEGRRFDGLFFRFLGAVFSPASFGPTFIICTILLIVRKKGKTGINKTRNPMQLNGKRV